MNPEVWKPERFLDFLAARRRLLANAINDFIESWMPEAETSGMDEYGVRRLMSEGECDSIEFKSSLRWDRRQDKVNKALEDVVIKTLAGFLNGKGGTLLIGVNDDGTAAGLGPDYKSSHSIGGRDGFERHLQQIVSKNLGEALSTLFLSFNFHHIDGEDICQISIEPSDAPVYVENGNKSEFYLRSGNQTAPLPVDETVKYVQRRWGGTN